MAKAIDEQRAWEAFAARDRSWDGRIWIAVRTTRIYCRPSCAARRPKREHVHFFEQEEAARSAGFRPCLRCKPDQVARDKQAIDVVVRLMETSERLPRLDQLAAAVGYAPSHFQRIFTRALGVSPAAYARAVRARRVELGLHGANHVTEAIYEAGYSAPSRFYEDADQRLGMTPSAWRKGGEGETIRFAVVESALGPMLVAATKRGICRLSFDEGEHDLRRRFPAATIVGDDGSIATLIEGAIRAVEQPAAHHDLPLDVAGTAFQQKVWQELRKIPPGETRSYAQIAAAIGAPDAVRATGSANGANSVAVLIPCHRVIRSDGSLGGYAYGVDRKRRLLEAETLTAQGSLQLAD